MIDENETRKGKRKRNRKSRLTDIVVSYNLDGDLVELEAELGSSLEGVSSELGGRRSVLERPGD